jgi:hypothetical protein
MKAVNKTHNTRNLDKGFTLLSLLRFLNVDPGEFFEKEFFIKMISLDNIFQRAKARETTAYAGGVPVQKKPGGFGCGLQNTFYTGFRNFKNIAHSKYRISSFPRAVFALAQIRTVKIIFPNRLQCAPDRAA